MTGAALVDNDVIIKLAAFRLESWLLETIARIEAMPATMLGVGKFVVRDRLNRASWLDDRESVLDSTEKLFSVLAFVEPTEDELLTAAEFEKAALRLNLELDGGESQLLTILLRRGYRVLLTGDKRATQAISRIAAAEAEDQLVCFEQILFDIVSHSDTEDIRSKVCRVPKADKTASICFNCYRSTASIASILAGLESYINDLRSKTGGILVRSADLSALAT